VYGRSKRGGFGRREPVFYEPQERLRAHPRMGHRDDLHPIRLSELAHRRVVARKYRLEWLRLFPFRMARSHLTQARKRKCGLPVQGMFRPERAVLIKRRDAICWLNILGT
jgi:hypothetical protein